MTIRWLLFIPLFRLVHGQAEYAAANMGLRLPPADGFVKAVPGRNPNLPAWLEDLGVGGVGEVFGSDPKVLEEALKSNEPVLIPRVDESEGGTLISSGEAGDLLNGIVRNSTIVSQHHGDSEEVIKANKAKGIVYPIEKSFVRKEASSKEENKPVAEEEEEPALMLPPPGSLLKQGQDGKDDNVAATIPLWRPKAKGQDPSRPLFILPADNEEVRPSANIDMFRPIVATSTVTTKVSGQMLTTATTVTVEAAALKFKSCIYGCPKVTSSDPLVGTTTIITILPFTIPCSLVSCPPCPACIQSTVSVSVCPFLSTVSGREKTVIVNGPTITVIKSTVTRSHCTSTKTVSGGLTECSCPTTTETVTLLEKALIDPASLIAEADDDDEDDHHHHQHEHDSTTSISHAALLKTKPADAAAAEFVFVTTTPTTEDLTLATTVTATSTKRRPKITITKTLLTHRGTSLITVTTTVLQVTTQDPGAGVCSTFIICNPTQFTCPAQVTNLPAIQAVVQSIMDGQQWFGDAGVKARRLSPNGAILDGEEKAGVLGDGTDLMGGLAPVNALGFGPGGMFQKALGGELIASKKEGEAEPKVVLMPDGPVTLTSPVESVSSSVASETSETAPSSSSSSTTATVGKALRGQSSSALPIRPSLLLIPLLITTCLLLL